MPMAPSGMIGSWSGDPANWKMADHDAPPEPERNDQLPDGPTFDASAPENLPAERLVKFIKDGLGTRSVGTPPEVVQLRWAVVILAEHLAAHLEGHQQTGTSTTRKAKQ